MNTVMKRMLIIILVALSFGTAQAQTFGEWFKQKATQRKYLLEQIAALRMYVGHLQESYTIARKGLTQISDIKSGELNLHTDYFSSLETVNPNVKGYWKVTASLEVHQQISNVSTSARQRFSLVEFFTGDEIQYLDIVFDRLLEDSDKTADELIAVTSDNKLEMTDDERLRRIDNLFEELLNQYRFARTFSNEANLLGASRSQETSDIEVSRVLSGLNSQQP